MSAVVRTVLGDIAATDLGITDAHDHLFFASAALPGEEHADPAVAAAELAGLAAHGGNALVHWTPWGLGGRTDDLASLSRSTGVHIVAATGRHRRAHYGPGAEATNAPDLADRFVREIEEGLFDASHDETAPPPRAGVIKIGAGYYGLDAWERASLAAAAAAATVTGAAICVHLEGGTHGDVVLQELERLGIPGSRVVLGHLTRNPDAALHRELAATGAFLAYDGPSRSNHATDWRLFPLLDDLAGAGYLDQLLLGADTTTRSATCSAGGGPGMAGLLSSTGARVARQLGNDAFDAIFRRNPARAFALRDR